MIVRPRTLVLEAIEPRLLMAVFTVNSVADVIDPDPGVTTLREAITLANTTPLGGDSNHVIDFAITPLGGLKTIAPASALPVLARAVLIDGFTQDGASANTLDVGDDAVLTIEINGTGAGAEVDGLVIAATDVTIRGLAIRNFAGDGIEVDGASGGGDALIAGNFIGTDATGTIGLGNGGAGVLLDGASGVSIGGGAAALRNLISGNGASGVSIDGGASGNVVAGNYLGTDAEGADALFNNLDGLTIANGSANTIGGATESAGNLFSGNRSDGVELTAGASGNVVVGNAMGTNATATAALPNGANGVRLNGAVGNVIGGFEPLGPFFGNLIGGNGADGVLAQNAASGNAIVANFIGVDPTGTQALANGDDGINLASGATANTIGGLGISQDESGNLISGNTSNGVVISASDGNSVFFNLIGTNADGEGPLPNGGDGIILSLGASGNTIGDSNVISGNLQNGVRLTGAGTTANQLFNNLIGTNATGTAALPNGAAPAVDSGPLSPFVGNGVLLQGGASGNTIGGGNVISGNRIAGLSLTGAGTTANLVVGNVIGLDLDGTAVLANGLPMFPMGVTDPEQVNAIGVHVRDGASNNSIGTSVAVSDVFTKTNTITGQREFDVRVDGPAASGTLIAGNLLGSDVTGTMNLAEGLGGILVDQSNDTTIGGTVDGAGNLISGYGFNAVNVDGAVGEDGAPVTGLLIAGNLIGTDVTGSVVFGNGNNGLELQNIRGATIGGLVAAARNVISASAEAGLLLSQSESAWVVGNFFGTDAGGTLGLGNGFAGIAIEQDGRANTIGGDTAAARNVFGNNGNSELAGPGPGIYIADEGSTGNLIAGNFIGTNAAGTGAIGNFLAGVILDLGTRDNTIGGPGAGFGNVISGNTGQIDPLFGDGVILRRTSGNLVTGNLIGTDLSGTLDLGNRGNGVLIFQSAFANTVAGNTIANNDRSGVAIGNAIDPDDASSGNVISGNLIAGNALQGVLLAFGVDSNAVLNNTIGGNAGNGVQLTPGVTATSVEGNAIGVSPGGNGGSGVLLADASGNTIGSNRIVEGGGFGVALAGAGASGNLVSSNVIGVRADAPTLGGNALAGVVLLNASANTVGSNVIGNGGSDGVQLFGGTGNLVSNNDVGAPTGLETAAPNAGNGILLQDTAGNTISGNVASGNERNGIDVEGSGSTGNFLASNLIGTARDGVTARANAGSGLLMVGVAGNTVGGNTISRNAGFGAALAGSASGNVLGGNFIGTDAAGTLALGNGLDGVMVLGAFGNTLTGNAIAGNEDYGAQVRGGSSGNLIAGNFVGTDATGARSLPNAFGGFFVDGVTANTLSGNVVSANLGNGVHLVGGATANLIAGNRLGTSAAGAAANGNFGSGVLVEGATGNTLSGNVASGNRGFGVGLIFGASGNVVSANFVGTDPTGTFAVGNLLDGVFVLQSAGNTLSGNVAAGNGLAIPSDGSGLASSARANVLLSGVGTTGNLLTGNVVGTDPSGSRSLDPNVGSIRFNPGGRTANGPFGPIDRVARDLRLDGVALTDGARLNTVGGQTSTDRNLISGNRLGVFVHDEAAANLVVGNMLGTTAAGGLMADSQQQQQGVVILNGADNTVGGASAAARNLISGQIETGVRVTQIDTASESRSPTTGNVVAGNYIGTDPTGTTPVPNNVGIYVFGAPGNILGLGSFGQADGGGNLISGNRAGGLQINNADTVNAITVDGQIVPNPAYVGNVASGNVVQGNRIGTRADGLARLTGDANFGNGTGVFINDAAGNVVRNNLISGNNQTGLAVFAPEAVDNLLEGNLIGPNVNGQTGADIGNGFGYIDARGRAQLGSGLFFNQVIEGANPSVSNDVRGNLGRQVVNRPIPSGPLIQSVRPVVNLATGLIDSIEVVFNGYLERSAVTLEPSNYQVERSGGGAVPLAVPPSYDEVGRRITLSLATGLATTDRYTLTVVGRPPGGLRSRPGIGVATPSVALAGNGAPGTNGVFSFVGTTPQVVTGAAAASIRRRR